MNPATAQSPAGLVPDAYAERFFGFFAWYVDRMLRKRFNAVRIAGGHSALIAEAALHDGPVIIALSHASWWDPLICVHLHHRFMRGRAALGPIDRAELAKFKFMRKLGLFGIDPDDPASFDPMVEHVVRRCADRPGTTIWITPQGRFTDVRDEVTIRPGISAIAARLASREGRSACRVVCLAIELGFWVDQRPEVFLSCEPCTADDPASTTSWHRAITRAMQANQSVLAKHVMSRDPDVFERLGGGDAPRIHPVYDMLLALRGKRRALDEGRRSALHAEKQDAGAGVNA